MTDIKKINLTDDELNALDNIRDLGGALAEYHNIVKSVADDYTGDTTPSEIRTDHPELDFMDDEEIEDLLRRAKAYRNQHQ